MYVSGVVFIYGVTGVWLVEIRISGFFVFFLMCWRKSNINLSFFLLTQKIWKPITNVLGDALEVVRVRLRGCLDSAFSAESKLRFL